MHWNLYRGACLHNVFKMICRFPITQWWQSAQISYNALSGLTHWVATRNTFWESLRIACSRRFHLQFPSAIEWKPFSSFTDHIFWYHMYHSYTIIVYIHPRLLEQCITVMSFCGVLLIVHPCRGSLGRRDLFPSKFCLFFCFPILSRDTSGPQPYLFNGACFSWKWTFYGITMSM